jgi:hypothetical protein
MKKTEGPLQMFCGGPARYRFLCRLVLALNHQPTVTAFRLAAVIGHPTIKSSTKELASFVHLTHS